MATKQELEQELAALRAQYGPTEDNVVAPDQPDPWALLQAKFDPKVVKRHPFSGFHYLAIDTVMNRLDEILGPNWTLAVQSVQLTPVDPEWMTYGKAGKPGFMASCTVRISALIQGGNPPIHTVRDGVGADYADDPDKAIKTALANAIKKAANGFGVGRYLWSEEERAAIDEAQKAGNDVKALKKAVVQRYLAAGTADEGVAFENAEPSEKMRLLGNAFGVDPTDLASAETLNSILER